VTIINRMRKLKIHLLKKDPNWMKLMRMKNKVKKNKKRRKNKVKVKKGQNHKLTLI
jgi:hypothetical protein